MRFVRQNRSGLVTLGALFLITVFAFLASHAGELLSDTDTATSALANPPLNVRETNVDAGGYIKVHEQGIVAVTGTVNVGNNPATQNVRVTNTTLPGFGTVRTFDQEVYPFDKDEDFDVDISKFTHIRLRVIVNGSGTVDVFYGTDGGYRGSFSVDSGDDHSVYLPNIPGTNLSVELRDPDGEQVFVRVFGAN